MGKLKAAPIAFQDGMVSQEFELPSPVVLYPGFYGTFFGFAREPDGSPVLCSCSRAALRNQMEFARAYLGTSPINGQGAARLLKKHFPESIVVRLIERGVSSPEEFESELQFENGVCHECNRVLPALRYCNAMYGSVFEQRCGWYINKQSYEYGVRPVVFRLLPKICPDEIFCQVRIGKAEFLRRYGQLSDYDLLLTAVRDREFQKCVRRIRKVIESEVRAKFGVRGADDTWATETVLFKIVTQMFPGEKVLRHYRPVFLRNLELDVFIPRLQIGFEYQGIQHFRAVAHWGGEEALRQVRARDRRKKTLCKKKGVKLICIHYTEDVSRSLIEEKLMLSR